MHSHWNTIFKYYIWNWSRSCSESYTISNSESNCIWLEYCNQCLADKSGKFLIWSWPSRMGSHWRLITIFWLSHWNIDFEYQTISHTNIFSRILMFYISTATGNYSIWNRLKSFTYPYVFSDFSHISSGQNIVISVLLIRLTILSGKFLMWSWPSWMGSSWLLITTFRLGSCTTDFEYQTQTLSDED